MSFGFHVGLQKTLYQTVSSHDQVKAIQCYIGGRQSFARRTFTEPDIDRTTDYLNAKRISLYIHACLCLNLASGKEEVLDSMIDELNAVREVGASTVFHIGSQNVSGQPTGTLDQIVTMIKRIGVQVRTRDNPLWQGTSRYQRYPLLLENAAGEGAKFGSTLSDLTYLFQELKEEGVGLCLDTAHAFGAGLFDFQTPDSIDRMFTTLDQHIGLERLQLIHINDSKVKFGGKADRHESLAKGYIWGEKQDGLFYLIQQCRKRGIDMILETPTPLEDYLKFLT